MNHVWINRAQPVAAQNSDQKKKFDFHFKIWLLFQD